MRYLDHDETAVLRTARQDWECTGHTYSQMTHGPIHWQPGLRAPNMVGAYPVNAMWTEHADGCPRALPAGADYIESLADVPPYESGPRYSIECAAAYVFGETVAETRARIEGAQ